MDIERNRSISKEIKVGVPQGSILGPLLFLIFINNLEQVAVNNNIDLTLFADDSTFTAYDKFGALNVVRNEIPEIKTLRNSDLISRTTSRFSINERNSQSLQAESANHYSLFPGSSQLHLDVFFFRNSWICLFYFDMQLLANLILSSGNWHSCKFDVTFRPGYIIASAELWDFLIWLNVMKLQFHYGGQKLWWVVSSLIRS